MSPHTHDAADAPAPEDTIPVSDSDGALIDSLFSEADWQRDPALDPLAFVGPLESAQHHAGFSLDLDLEPDLLPASEDVSSSYHLFSNAIPLEQFDSQRFGSPGPWHPQSWAVPRSLLTPSIPEPAAPRVLGQSSGVSSGTEGDPGSWVILTPPSRGALSDQDTTRSPHIPRSLVSSASRSSWEKVSSNPEMSDSSSGILVTRPSSDNDVAPTTYPGLDRPLAGGDAIEASALQVSRYTTRPLLPKPLAYPNPPVGPSTVAFGIFYSKTECFAVPNVVSRASFGGEAEGCYGRETASDEESQGHASLYPVQNLEWAGEQELPALRQHHPL